MKREDVKNKIPGITDEQLNWIMQENGADINREKSAATALQTQLDNANAQLKTAQDGLKAFDGVDVAGLQEQVTKLKADMKAQAEGFAFDNALDAAILGKKGRSVKAVRALLDLDALKGSADRSTDIGKGAGRSRQRPTRGPLAMRRTVTSRTRGTWSPPEPSTAHRDARRGAMWTRWKPSFKALNPEHRTCNSERMISHAPYCKSGALLRAGGCKAARHSS